MTTPPSASSPRPTMTPSGVLSGIREWLTAVQTRDLASIHSRPRRFLLKIAQVLMLVCRLDVIDRLQLHSQALTYVTLLAVVPLLVVVFAMVSGFGGMEDLRQRLEELILDNISASDEVRAAVAEYLTRVLGGIRTGGFSAVSVVILIYSVLSLLGHIEFSINSVFGSKSLRPWLSRLITYWALLTLGPLLLGASFAFTAALQSFWLANVVDSLGLGGLLLRLVPLVVTWIAFAAMYLVVPTTRVRLPSAVFAAIVAGSLWTVAKILYAVYAKRALSVHNIYGSLATVPLFILWIYVSWLLVLLGAQLTFAYQHASTYAKESRAHLANQTYRERVACRVFLEVARDFFYGLLPTDPDRLCTLLDVPRSLLENIISDLKTGGLVREVEGKGLVPAKDLSLVTVSGVVQLLRDGIGVHLAMRDDEASRAVNDILDVFDLRLATEAGHTSFRDLVMRLEKPTAALAPNAAHDN